MEQRIELFALLCGKSGELGFQNRVGALQACTIYSQAQRHEKLELGLHERAIVGETLHGEFRFVGAAHSDLRAGKLDRGRFKLVGVYVVFSKFLTCESLEGAGAFEADPERGRGLPGNGFCNFEGFQLRVGLSRLHPGPRSAHTDICSHR